MRDEVLISIAVIAYNSERTIIETLESIKNQTYRNIELIVSDDCSQDRTIEITRLWLESNSSRFVRTELLTIDHNTGVPANVNRALFACQGEWMKSIAADDILLYDCIENCLNFASSNDDCNWLAGKILKFRDIFDDKHLLADETAGQSPKFDILNGPIEMQKKAIVSYDFIAAPAVFVKCSTLKEIGGFDEQYKFMEDWPMWYKLILQGEKCFFIDKYIVGYRVNEHSITRSADKLFNYGFKKSEFLFTKKELFKYNSFSYKANKTLHYWLCTCFQWLNINNTRFFTKKLYFALFRLIDFLA